MQSPVGFNISNLAKPMQKASTRASEKKSQTTDLFGQKVGEESKDKELNLSSPAPVAPIASSSPKVESKERVSSPTEFKSALSNKSESPVRTNFKKSEEPKINDEISSLDESPMEGAPQAALTISAVKPDLKLLKMETVPTAHIGPMNAFLAKMKEQLDVSPEEILSAFKSLSKEELAAPPEQNINKMVQQLGLNPQEALVAAQMFKQLLIKTDSAKTDMAKPEVKTPEPMRAGAGLEQLGMLSAKDFKGEVKAKTLDQMNNSFFMKPTPKADTQDKNWLAGTAPIAKAAPEVEAPVTDDQEPVKGFEIPEEMNTAAPIELSKEEIEAIKARVAQMQTEPKKVEAKAAKPMAMPVSDDESAPMAAPVQSPTAPKGMEKLAAAIPSENMTTPQAQMTAPLATPAPITIPSFAKPGSSNSEHGPSDDDKKGDIAAVDGGDDQAVATPFVAPTGTTTAEAKAQKVEGQIAPMAAHELVQHAHVMVKDGGGEMKVMLRPDGLGEVSMKVAVKDGKVSVQLITQSDEAKQILEHGFKGLKEGLSAHHLNLESIKVDTASNAGQSLDKQMKDQQQEQAKQQARQFFEQFSQDNSGWKRSMFDIPGAEVYRSQTQTRPGGPSGASASAMSSRRLDLVA
jgi:flagellar hook-length control protein FliK